VAAMLRADFKGQIGSVLSNSLCLCKYQGAAYRGSHGPLDLNFRSWQFFNGVLAIVV
jgi:hypothetical protein